MLNLEIDLLRTFVAVIEMKGFTTAGELLGLSQSAVSLQVKRLETALGHAVFKRSRRELALTRQGELLLGFARRMLELNDESVRALVAPALIGAVRLGVSEYFVPRHLPQVVARFARAYPQLHLSLRVGLTADLRRLLAEGELDMVIGRRDSADRPRKLVFREPLYWVARRSFSLERSESVPFVALSENCAYRADAAQRLDEAGRDWRLVYCASGVQGMQSAVEAGLGVACLPLSAVLSSMRILGAQEGLPALADSEIVLYEEADAKSAHLVDVIRESLPRFSAEVMSGAAQLAEAA